RCLFFFFQAEDGIRDRNVTGVQTCALPIFGGCMEVLETLKGTELWPSKEMWRDCILFFETSEEKPPPRSIRYWLRNYAAQGILDQVNGIIFGKPQDEEHYEAYKVEIITVMKEYELQHIPIMYNANFGHTEPKCILPYGVQAEINCEHILFQLSKMACSD